jgi:uncharacterized protein YycO
MTTKHTPGRENADLRFGRSDGKEDTRYPEKELRKGTKVEYEHTRHTAIAKEIAKDHLEERPDYYKKLKKMEDSPVEKTAMGKKMTAMATLAGIRARRAGGAQADKATRVAFKLSGKGESGQAAARMITSVPKTKVACGDMLDYFRKHPEKLKEKQRRDAMEKTAMVNAFFDELEKIAIATATPQEPSQDKLIGAAAVGGGALAAAKAKPLVTGRTRLYHGTSAEQAAQIRKTGLRSAAQVGVRGVTDVLPPEIRDPSRELAFTTPSKGTARTYQTQAERLKNVFKGKPNPEAIQSSMMAMKMDPTVYMDIMNPLNNKGIVTMDVPMWRKDVASRVVDNPEARGGLDNFRKATRQGFDFRPELVKDMESKAMYDSLTKDTKVFKGGVDTEFIRGAKNFKGVSLREIGQYAKARPGRFGAGLALGAAGVGAAAYGAHKLLKKPKQKTAEISQVELAKKQHAVKSEQHLLKTLKPGDLVFSAPHRKTSGGFMGKVFKPLSRKIQGTDFGHTAMYVGDGKIIDTRIERSAKAEPLSNLTRRNNVVAVRPKGATAGERKKAVEYMRSKVGVPYSKTALLRAATPFQGKFKGKGPEESNAAMCSGLAANAYSKRKFAPVSRKYIRPSQILASKQVKPVAYLETAPQPM